MAAADQIASLTEQLAELKAQLEGLGNGGGAPVPTVVKVSIPRERKLRRYGGGRDDKVLEDWISDAHRAVEAQEWTNQEAVEFLYNSLEGAARDEVRLRPADDWKDPDLFFQVLRDVFGEKLSKTQQLQRFFARKQRERESIQDFALSLMSMAEHLARTHESALDNKDQNLRDTFVENLRDLMLRRDLKRYVREHPAATFQAVRQEAQRSLEDTDHGNVRHASSREVVTEPVNCAQVSGGPVGKVIHDLAEGQKALVEKLAQQQKFMEEQQKVLVQLTERLTRTPQPQNAPRGPRRCYNCGEVGHLRPNCPKPPRQRVQPAPQRESNSNSPQH